MARYVTKVRTPMPVAEAFAYMADLRNFAHWDPGVSSSVQVEGDGTGPGSAYDVTVKAAGRNLTLRYRTVEFDAPRALRVEAKSTMFTSIDRVTVETVDGATVVTYDAELRLNGVFRLGELGLRLAFNRIGDRAAAGLRRALNGEATV